MKGRQPKYSMDEHARLGDQAYEQHVRPKVEAGHHGEIVAIDVDSNEFELGETSLEAANKLLARLPDAQIWCVRIGHRAVHRFGPRIRVARS